MLELTALCFGYLKKKENLRNAAMILTHLLPETYTSSISAE